MKLWCIAWTDLLATYVAGLSGVGKTTFITEELLKEYDAELLIGEKNIEAWAINKLNKLKILFIDEENLDGFMVTETRKPAIKLLNELLLLRESRRNTATRGRISGIHE